ncbi:MAG: protein translocase subunit SecD [Dehalococcoidia bacterium]
MSRRNILTLVGIALLVAFASWVTITHTIRLPVIGEREGMVLGLDLSGGTHLVYEADFTGIAEGDRAARLEGAKQIIEKRVNAYGVSEPVIQTMGASRISIQLPGVTDIDEAKDLVGKTAELIFREQATIGSTSIAAAVNAGDTQIAVDDVTDFAVEDVLAIGSGETGEAKTIKAVDEASDTITVDSGFAYAHAIDEPVTNLWITAVGTIDGQEKALTGAYLTPNTYIDINPQTAEPVVTFEWDATGAELFSQITGRLIGQPLGIFLDEELISAPTVQSQIRESGIITGLTMGEAQRLSIQLNTGALPVPLTAIQEQTVDAILGADSLNKSLVAGMIGLVLVLLFMMTYYRLPGVLASIALIIYAAILLTIFKLVPVTLTLAGIAALILSIGMAVDANILIFERTKEEIRGGKSLRAAIETGFSRAWPSIRDSNVSTFIICAILYWFGSRFGAAPVMGFALTLFIGVAVSMFSAIIITRTFLRTIVVTPLARSVSLFRP